MLIGILVYSCSSYEGPTNSTLQKEKKDAIEANVAQKEFAQILSKAVYSNSDMRKFIKEKAIKQFDNDYDVFYPYVKDEKVTDNKTFRDILLSYCSDKDRFSKIEESLPLLNILVPNLSLFKAFSADTWDLNDNEVAVSYTLGNKNSVLYGNGNSIMTLKPNEVPDFPLLVVKNSERMKIVSSTRATNGEGEYTYAFANPAFDGSSRKSTRYITYYDTIPQESTDPYVKASDLDTAVIKAYNMFHNDDYSYDRDYIYYGLSYNHPTNGRLNQYMREHLYAFKMTSNIYYELTNLNTSNPKLDHPGKDKNTNARNDYGDISHDRGSLTDGEVINGIWTKGNFTIRFNTMIGTKGGAISSKDLIYSVPPTQLFQVDSIHVDYRHSTGFRRSRYVYTIYPGYLRPRWVYVKNLQYNTNDNLLFENAWDISNYSMTVHINVYEDNDPETIETTDTHTYEYDGNSDFSGDISGGTAPKYDIKLGLGESRKTTNTISQKTTVTVGNYSLGEIDYSYYDPVIISDSEKDKLGYKVNAYGSGIVQAIILPERER